MNATASGNDGARDLRAGEANATVDSDAHVLARARSGEWRHGVQATKVEFELEADTVLERHCAPDARLERACGVERDMRRARQEQLVTILDAAVEAEEARH